MTFNLNHTAQQAAPGISEKPHCITVLFYEGYMD